MIASQMKTTMDENFKKNQEFMLASQKMQVSFLQQYFYVDI